MMRYQRMLLRLAAAFCAVVALAGMGTSALAADTFYWNNAVNVGSTSAPGNVFLSKYQLYDRNGVIRPVTSGKAFAASISDLLATCERGAVNASKDGFFASDADAAAGVVKLMIDVVGKPPAEAIDVMFVLDESGSMTMYSTPQPSPSPSNFQYTLPCLNPKHYYKVYYMYRLNSSSPWIRNQVYDFYPNDPLYKDVLNNWEDPAFYNEFKKELARQHGVTFADITLENWLGTYDFGANHYNENGSRIAKSGYHDSTYGGLSTGAYYSPPFNNADGCIDRQLIAKSAIKKMVDEIALKNTSQSRIGYSSFGGELAMSVPMDNTNSLTQLNTALNVLNGYDNTNYAAGLNDAYRLLTSAAPKPAGRQTYVIFITDGMPNQPSGAEAAARTAAAQIRTLPDTTLYCVGIKSAASTLLREMSTDGNHYKDCATQAEFEEYLRIVTSAIRGKTATLIDVIGDAYDLVCDAAHPISLEEGTSATASKSASYDTLAKAQAAGLVYDAAGESLRWRIPDAHEFGNRLSFYVKLHEDNYKKQLSAYEGSFNTNESAIIDFTKVTDTVAGAQGTPASLALLNPATIKVAQSVLTAAKRSDRPGETVRPGEGLGYTITVTNTGKVDMTGVVVSDEVPAETAHVPGSGGTLSGGWVNFRLASLAAGSSADVRFQVKILEGTRNIVNYPMFGTEDERRSLVSGRGACYANLVENPRGASIPPAASTNVPKTGDRATPLTWAALLLLSTIGCLVAAAHRRKRRGA